MATGHLWIYGIIGEAPKGSADKYYSFRNFREELDPKATDYTVHIYSPGGDVFEGQAIYNGLKNTGKSIKVFIEGVCASIATLIAGAADPGKLFIQENAQFMVHPPKFNNISGDEHQLRTGAEQLAQIKTLLISVYRKRTGLPEERMRAIVDKETWMLPDVAKELGFVDDVVESMKAVAFATFKPTTEMEDKNVILQAIENLGNKISMMFTKPKNEIPEPKNVTDTLADGTVIIVESEDGDWAGKRVTYEDGSPLPPGDHALSRSRLLVVGEGGVISEVKESEAEDKAEPENNQEMEALKKLEAAEARIKELESALEAQTANATQAEAKAKSMENKFNTDLKAVNDELARIKNTTVGDSTPPARATKLPFQAGPVTEHPLATFFKEKVTNVRNTD